MKLTHQIMMEKMLKADPTYDGQFITGVMTTGIYCLPSCRARKPKPENVVFYSGPAQAQAANLRPCLRCKPDDYDADIHTEELLFEQILAFPLEKITTVAALAKTVNISARHLQGMFWRQKQQTPNSWINERRITEARQQLLTGNATITDIAFGTGYSSLSVFGAQFSRRTGMSACAFRAIAQGQGFSLRLPAGISLPLLLAYLGRDRHNTTQKLEGNRLSIALVLPDGARVIEVDIDSKQARVLPTGPLAAADTLALWQMLWRVLGLEHMIALPPCSGLPLCLTPTFWDALLWAVVGQQVTFRAACTFRNRLIRCLQPEPLAQGLYAPPQPEDILQLSKADWHSIGLTQKRRETLCALASSPQLLALASGPIPRLERALKAIPGFGPWSTAYALLRGLGLPDIAPVNDSALASALQRHFGLPYRPTPAQVTSLLAPYAPQRSLATINFWQSLSGEYT